MQAGIYEYTYIKLEDLQLTLLCKVLICISNPLPKLQFSLWDSILHMHVTFMLHDQHEYTMHVNITVPCMLPQHSCYMNMTCMLPSL